MPFSVLQPNGQFAQLATVEGVGGVQTLLVSGGGAPAYDSDAATLFAAMTAQPDTTRKGLYNSLIVGLKSDSVWSKLDVLYLLAAHDSQAALLNVKAPATFAGSAFTGLTFTADRGFAGGGSGYIDTGFNPATAGGQYTQNSAHVSTYTNATTSDIANTIVSVGKVSGSDAFIRPRSAADGFDGRINSATNTTFGTIGTRLGGRALSRVTAADSRGFVNGVQNGATNTSASSAIASGTFTLFRLATTYNTLDRLACASIGGGLSTTEAAALHSRVATFLAAIGAN